MAHGETLVLASTSPLRTEALRHIFPEKRIISIPGGEEPKDLHPVDVAGQKVLHAQEFLTENGMQWDSLAIQKPYGIIAVDAMTTVPQSNPDGLLSPKRAGKIPSLGVLFQQFIDMESYTRIFGQGPVYTVTSGTCFQNGGDPVKRSVDITVQLEPKNVGWLSTSEGRETYLQLFHTLESPMTPLKTSGGLSLATLEHMGMIRSINGVVAKDPAYPEALQSALFGVAVGFHPDVLNDIERGASDRILTWQPYCELTKRCMRLKDTV